jgi:basic membrane lipoprotein Med (substrate-binding protein (PBP1-ABC) superfamily)
MRRLIARRNSTAALLAVCAAVALAGVSVVAAYGSSGGSTARAANPPKIKMAALYLAKFAGDAYGQAFLNSFKVLKKKYGIDVHLVENVPYTTQATTITQNLLQQGYNVILDTDAGGKLFYDACKKYPKALCIEQTPVGALPPNTIGMNEDEFAPQFLMGVAAGMLTKSGTVGMITPYKVPNQTAQTNAFALGCQYVRKNCQLRNIYINNYFKPPAEIDAANTLVNAHADVVQQQQDDQSALETASKRGAWSFGTYLAVPNPPAKYVTSPQWDVAMGKAISRILDARAAGTLAKLRAGGTVFGTPKPVDITLAPWGKNVPANVRAKVEALQKKMNAGWNPFKGPIYDAKGKLRVKAGEAPAIRNSTLATNWIWPVKGVIGG